MGGQDNNKKADQQPTEVNVGKQNKNKQNDNKKSTFDKRIEISKTVAVLLIPIFIAGFGYWGTHILEKIRISETNNRVYIELMSKREEAESALRKDMFNFIIQSFFKTEEKSCIHEDEVLESKVLELELLAYNFHESFNLKPLFSHLLKRTEYEKDKKDNNRKYSSYLEKYRGRLKKVATEIIDKQMTVLEEVGDEKTSDIILILSKEPEKVGATKDNEIDLNSVISEMKNKMEIEKMEQQKKEEGEGIIDQLLSVIFQRKEKKKPEIIDQLKKELEEINAKIENFQPNVFDFDLTIKETTRTFRIVVEKVALQRQELYVRLEISDPINDKKDEVKTDGKGNMFLNTAFWLGFFDFPFIDNVRLPGDQRCALVLENFRYSKEEESESDSKMRLSADFTTVLFPGSYGSLKEKPYIDDVVKKLLSSKK